MKIFGVTGWKNSGKTGLMERLVAEITARGFSVSTVKHAHHSFDVDQPGKDSHRHRVAGAREVLLASASRWALMHETRPPAEPPLAELLARVSPVDLVLIEGYKRDRHPKIEAFRAETGNGLIAPRDATIRAIASSAGLPRAAVPLQVPVFDLDDTKAIADFVLRETGLIGGHAAAKPALAPPPLKNDCFALPAGVEWTPVDTALAQLRAGLTPVAAVGKMPVAEALGRILVRDVVARRANPPGANSAVDGYGFAHASLAAGAGPQILPLLAGRSAAGAPFCVAPAGAQISSVAPTGAQNAGVLPAGAQTSGVAPTGAQTSGVAPTGAQTAGVAPTGAQTSGVVPAGWALRILTGALLPEGVDTVIMQEDVRVQDGHIAFHAPRAGANTRAAGEDLAAGQIALAAGRRLRAPDLALLSAVGIARVDVHARLRVGVLSTGDELVAPGATMDVARTYDANRPMLLGLVQGWGHAPVDLGQVPDDRDALARALDHATARVDVIITSGGASAGEEDHVSALLSEAGTMQTWRIAMKPGRPLALGLWRGVALFGLPGNPVAALVCALIFARPALSQLAGGGWLAPPGFTVPAAFEKQKKPGRREYLRARLNGQGAAEVFKSEGSGRISGLSWADGLVELGDGARHVRPGDPVRYLPFAGFGV